MSPVREHVRGVDPLEIAIALGDRPMVSALLDQREARARAIRAARPSRRRITPRLLDWLGLAMLLLFLASLNGAIAAIAHGARTAGWLFLGAQLGCAITMIAIAVFQERLRG